MEARAIRIVVNGTEYWAERKRFRTGSVGYFFSGKVMIEGVKHQCQLQLIEVGSKSRQVGTISLSAPQAEDCKDQMQIDEAIDQQQATDRTTVPVGKVDVNNAAIRPSPDQTDANPKMPPKVSQTKRKRGQKGDAVSQPKTEQWVKDALNHLEPPK